MWLSLVGLGAARAASPRAPAPPPDRILVAPPWCRRVALRAWPAEAARASLVALGARPPCAARPAVAGTTSRNATKICRQNVTSVSSALRAAPYTLGLAFGRIGGRFFGLLSRIARAAQKQGLQGRHHHQQHDRPDQHAPDHHGRKRPLYLAADAGGHCGWQQAYAGRQCHLQDRPYLFLDGVQHRFDHRHAARCDAMIAANDEDSAHNRHAEQRNEPNRRRDAEIQSGDVESENPTANRKRDSEQSHEAVTQ